MISPGRVVDQVALASDATRALASAPWLLAYPILASVLVVGLPVLATGLLVLTTPPPAVLVTAWAGTFVVLPVAFSFVMVAYCHELDAVLAGRGPTPGSGLRVASRRLPRVVAAGLVVGTGAFAVHYAGETMPFADALGVGSTWGLRIAGVFAYPAVATTDASLRETVGDVLAAAEAQWGSSLVATVGTQALGTVVAWTGIVAAVALGLASFLGVVPGVWPLGPLTLPLVVGLAGPALAFAVQFAVDGVCRTALYHYAQVGRLPPALSMNPGTLFEVDGASAGDHTRPAR